MRYPSDSNLYFPYANKILCKDSTTCTNSFYIGHSCYEDFCGLKSYLSKVISNRSNSDEFDESNQKAYPNSRLEKKKFKLNLKQFQFR